MPKHAEFSRCGESFHAAAVIARGGDRSCWRRKSSKARRCPSNASDLGTPVGRLSGRIGLEVSRTGRWCDEKNSLHSDTPWVYKASNTGGQIENPSSMSFPWRSLRPLIREDGNLGRGDLRWSRGCVCQPRNLWSRDPQDALRRSQVVASVAYG